MPPLALSEFEVGPTYVAEWYDEGTRRTPARIRVNNIKRTAGGLEGGIEVTLFHPLRAPDDVGLRLENHSLVGPRKAEYVLRLPNPKEAASAVRVVAASEERSRRAVAAPRARAPRAPKEPKSARPSKVTAADPFGAFRPNTCKAMLALVLSDGKRHPRKDLEALCARSDFGKGQIKWTVVGLIAKGVAVRDEKDYVQVELAAAKKEPTAKPKAKTAKAAKPEPKKKQASAKAKRRAK